MHNRLKWGTGRFKVSLVKDVHAVATPSATSSATGSRHPLCVGLDGTLVRTDLFIEAVLALIKQNLLNAFLLLF